ncbi:MAG: SRPBCC domain-containing protein [Novosphingobium sp.]
MVSQPEIPDPQTRVERPSENELVVIRSFRAPVHLVYRAWADPALFRQWWIPRSCGMTLVSCEMDVRVGGTYRLEIGHVSMDQPMTFFGTYLEVEPDRRIVWTNEESAEGAVTTVSFAERAGGTDVTISNLFPSAEALEQELASGACDGTAESLRQLNELLQG